MLDFNEVRLRGLQRAAARHSDAELPPHVHVIAPIVQQLLNGDYCAENGALLTPPEAMNLGALVNNMAVVMDGLEAERDAAQVEVREMEAHLEAAEAAMSEARRRGKVIVIVAGVALWHVVMGGLVAWLA